MISRWVESSLRQRVDDMVQGKSNLAPIATTLGIKVLQFGEGKSTMIMTVDERYHNSMGTVHGGIITDLADASMGIALVSTLGDGEIFTTLELKMNFLRPIVN